MSRRLLPVVMCLVACSGRIDSVEPDSAPQSSSDSLEGSLPDGIELQEIGDETESIQLPEIRLCQLVTFFDAGAGLYRVERMIGVTSSEPYWGYVYMQLALLDPWSANAPEQPVARLAARIYTGDFSTMFVSARLGEELGVLLDVPRPDNEERYNIGPQSTFRNLGAGYSNGVVFSENPVTAAELGASVSAAIDKAGQPDCPDQPPPDPEPTPVPDDVIIGEEIEGYPPG